MVPGVRDSVGFAAAPVGVAPGALGVDAGVDGVVVGVKARVAPANSRTPFPPHWSLRTDTRAIRPASASVEDIGFITPTGR